MIGLKLLQQMLRQALVDGLLFGGPPLLKGIE